MESAEMTVADYYRVRSCSDTDDVSLSLCLSLCVSLVSLECEMGRYARYVVRPRTCDSLEPVEAVGLDVT